MEKEALKKFWKEYYYYKYISMFGTIIFFTVIILVEINFSPKTDLWIIVILLQLFAAVLKFSSFKCPFCNNLLSSPFSPMLYFVKKCDKCKKPVGSIID
jgi:hypothetical protein